ncbi:MAG: WecB/TagA/CpsF family glycosyltransferase [Gammaproteobacteria bacterium]|nr:WecB/TagA/CpsF family glycosyltransferase [Gammaproteobacteria bacterium]
MAETLAKVETFVESGKVHQHVVVNVNKVIKADRNPELRRIINQCDLINCDGMPIVWASKLLGKPLPERVAGIDLFTNLITRSAEKGWRVFFLGAREPVVAKVVEVFQAKYPNLSVAGYRNGYWEEQEEGAVVETIRNSSPHILFVAISSPKKEEFLGRHLARIGVPFAMGVGGSFDVVAGLTNRAPLWMQKSGLEWFFRFLQEPRRLFGRYFVEGVAFVKLLSRELWLSKTASHIPDKESKQ